MVRVMGLGSSVPFDGKDPLGPLNRRISILVLGQLGQERWSTGGDTPISEAEALERILDRRDAAAGAQAPATAATPTAATPPAPAGSKP